MRFIELLKLSDIDNAISIYMRLFSHLPRKRRIRRKVRDKIRQAINDIINGEAKLSDELIICLEDVNDDLEDLHYIDVYGWDKENDVKYGLEINQWSKTAGYQVDEVSVEKYGMDKVVALVLWEMTFFGYSNDAVQRHVEGWSKATYSKHEFP